MRSGVGEKSKAFPGGLLSWRGSGVATPSRGERTVARHGGIGRWFAGYSCNSWLGVQSLLGLRRPHGNAPAPRFARIDGPARCARRGGVLVLLVLGARWRCGTPRARLDGGRLRARQLLLWAESHP